MKKLLTLITLFVVFECSGQKNRLWGMGQNISDTIPSILLCADTTKIVSIILRDEDGNTRFEGLTTIAGSTFNQITTFTIVGYRVAGNILYTLTPKRSLIDGIIYLDDKKRLLPKSFIVLSFVDRK